MSIWRTIPVTAQPALTLQDWSVIELPDGKRHFVGYCVENCEGRVSSTIVSVDPRKLCGSTATGRVYRLAGEPGYSSDAEYVLRSWLAMYKLTTWTDITTALWRLHLNASTVGNAEDDSTAVHPTTPAAGGLA